MNKEWGTAQGSKQRSCCWGGVKEGMSLPSLPVAPSHRQRSPRSAAGQIKELWGQSCSHITCSGLCLWSSLPTLMCKHSGVEGQDIFPSDWLNKFVSRFTKAHGALWTPSSQGSHNFSLYKLFSFQTLAEAACLSFKSQIPWVQER